MVCQYQSAADQWLRRVRNLVTLESPHTSASSRGILSHHAMGIAQLPHFDCLVETTTDQRSAVWCKCNGVYAVLVTLDSTIEPFHQEAVARVPHSDALVE